MLSGIRTRATWMAIGLVLGGGGLAVAGVAVVDTPDPKGPKIEVPGKATSQEARTADDEDAGTRGPAGAGDNERVLNHGFYVSSAAHCEDVDDAQNDVHFTAPADCDSDGAAHGEYVSSVARSSAGKKDPGSAGEGTD